MMYELGTKNSTVYKVECIWFDSEKPKIEFGNYYASAFTDKRDPGSSHEKMLINTQPELFSKRLGDSLSFKTPEEALAVAKFIAEYGHTTAGYSGREDWRKIYRGPIKTRVVEEHNFTSRREIKEK